MYTTVKLTKVEADEPITRERHGDFYYQFQLGVLLTLKAEGFLNPMQYRIGEEALKEQRRAIERPGIDGGTAS